MKHITTSKNKCLCHNRHTKWKMKVKVFFTIQKGTTQWSFSSSESSLQNECPPSLQSRNEQPSCRSCLQWLWWCDLGHWGWKCNNQQIAAFPQVIMTTIKIIAKLVTTNTPQHTIPSSLGLFELLQRASYFSSCWTHLRPGSIVAI